jgi:hypothetical protein
MLENGEFGLGIWTSAFIMKYRVPFLIACLFLAAACKETSVPTLEFDTPTIVQLQLAPVSRSEAQRVKASCTEIATLPKPIKVLRLSAHDFYTSPRLCRPSGPSEICEMYAVSQASGRCAGVFMFDPRVAVGEIHSPEVEFERFRNQPGYTVAIAAMRKSVGINNVFDNVFDAVVPGGSAVLIDTEDEFVLWKYSSD